MSRSDDRPATFGEAASGLDRPTYENLRRALELGRWPDGRPLEARQREVCMEAVLTWEAAHLPPEARSGFVRKGACASDTDTAPIRIITDD